MNMSKDSVVVGIDTGANGAIACIGVKGDVHWVDDMPSVVDRKNKSMVDGRGLRDMLADLTINYDVTVIVEDVHAMPKQGVTSSFNFGMAKGVILGVIQGLGLPYELVAPSQWKRDLKMAGHHKDYVRTRAIEMWPDMYEFLKLKKHIDRADALMIAHWKVA